MTVINRSIVVSRINPGIPLKSYKTKKSTRSRTITHEKKKLKPFFLYMHDHAGYTNECENQKLY